MLVVLVLAAAIWGAGRLMGASRQARLYMLGLLYVAVLALHLVLPDGHPLRMATGESRPSGRSSAALARWRWPMGWCCAG